MRWFTLIPVVIPVQGSVIGAILLAVSHPLCLLAQNPTPVLSPEAALHALMIGNGRFCRGQSLHPRQGALRRKSLVAGQTPIATVLSCSDSRVTPELIFDQGLGDLFVIRDAGNSVDDEVLGSIEYSVEHLGTQLIVVVGHEKCGAVTAAVKGDHEGTHVDAVLIPLNLAVQQTKGRPGDQVNNAVRDNILIVVDELKKSQPVLAHFLASGKLQIVGAEYHLESGKVEFLK
jgi:carbonic anhydrase